MAANDDTRGAPDTRGDTTDSTGDVTVVVTSPDDSSVAKPSLTQQPQTDQQPAPAQVSGGSEPASAQPQSIRGRFELGEMLGSGGMGSVYRARDLRKVEAQDRDPWVAIKLLNDDFQQHPSALIALQREARKSQSLTHPNIVKVFDFDRDGDTVYMTMELLRGEDLSRQITAHPMGIGTEPALKIAREVGDALRHAHESGIVHADLSPKNVFLTEEGPAKVLDFGIARAIANAETDGQLGQETIFDPASLGGLTPGYASIERLCGEEPEPRDDLYGLACIIYELLSGEHPHGYRTAKEARDRGTRPERIKGLPRQQWQALSKALALERADRYASVDEFLTDFLPAPRRPRWPVYTAAGLLLAASALALWQVLENRSAEQAREAELQGQRQAIASRAERLQEERRSSTRQVSEDYLRLARSQIESGQLQEAQATLARLRETAPDFEGIAAVENLLADAKTAAREQREQAEQSRMEVQQLLALAEDDIAAGRLARPAQASAWTRYRQISALDPGNADAEIGRQRLVRLHLQGFDRAMNEGELGQAGQWLDDLAIIAPDNNSLASLRSELAVSITEVQQREQRITRLMEQARNPPGDKPGEVSRRLYREVLEIDPANDAAKRELASLEAELSDRARREASRMRDSAQSLLEREPATASNYREALVYLREALGKDADSPGVPEMLAGMPARYAQAIAGALEREDYPEADSLLQGAFEIAPADAGLRELEAELARITERKEQPVLPASF